MEFEQIYNTYFKAVYRYIWQLSGNEHIAEEITGETFFKAMKSINNFRGECDMRVWLCQIAKNTYFSYLKKNGKIESIDEAKFQNIANPNDFIDDYIEMHAPVCQAGIVFEVNTQEEAAQLRKILHSISEPYKEVFMWRVFGELSFNEIGDLYGKTDNWACVTYHRARKMIQSRLEEI